MDREPSYVLVLATGGTIGMQKDNKTNAYRPLEPGAMAKEMKRQPLLHDPNCKYEHPGQTKDIRLALPLTNEGKRVLYDVREYDPQIDSSNMTFEDYEKLANDIREAYEPYNGFVIMQGTDTMAYTASHLSFMFENLGKPVVITGSQIPIFEQRTDGLNNLISSIVMAGSYEIPEVAILFANRLYRGNRTTKLDASRMAAFWSPHISPLAELEVTITVNKDLVRECFRSQQLSVNLNMCDDVLLLKLVPAISTSMVEKLLCPPTRGVVLETFGIGNSPKKLLKVLEKAYNDGIIIVNVTQCPKGTVSPKYEAGQALEKVGVIAGFDMTTEAALAKLRHVLAVEHLPVYEKRKMMQENLRDEMTKDEVKKK